MEITTHANTNLWQFNLDVVHRKTQKVIFQPRILCWYEDRKFRDGDLPAPYTGMNDAQLYKALGVSNRVYNYCSCFSMVSDQVTYETKRLSPLETETVMHTPKGDLTMVNRSNTSNGGSYPSKWWITSEEEMNIHRWVLENSHYEFDMQEYERVKAIWEFAGAPQAYFPRVNMQYLFHDVMGPEEGIYALYDYPETVEKYFAALRENQERCIETWIDSPLEICNFGDNIHAGVLSPALFEKYVLPEYQHRNELLHAGGLWTNAHWDGDVKPVLQYAQATGLDGIEAITPKPQGDVTLQEVRQALGDKMFLMDGVAAILFDPKLYPIQVLEDQVKECLDLFGGHLILGISDEMCSTGVMERVLHVRDMVDEYNSHIKE